LPEKGNVQNKGEPDAGNWNLVVNRKDCLWRLLL